MACGAYFVNICIIFVLFCAYSSLVDGRLDNYKKNDVGFYCSGFTIGGAVDLGYGTASTIKLTAENIPVDINEKCEFRIGAPKGFGVTIHVQSSLFKTWWSRSQCINFLEIGKNSTFTKLGYTETLCANFFSITDGSYNTYSFEGIVIKFNTSSLKKDLGFHSLNVYVTAYTRKCDNYWNSYVCSNGRCISNKLICDGVDNCGDNSDETDSSCTAIVIDDDIIITSSRGYIVTYTMTPMAILLIICIALRCCCASMQRQKIQGQTVLVNHVRDRPPPYAVLVNTENVTKNKTAKQGSNTSAPQSRQNPTTNSGSQNVNMKY